METFEASIENEEDLNGHFDLNGLSQALKNIDISLSEDEYEHLVWAYFQETKDVRKLKRGPLYVDNNNQEQIDNKNESIHSKHSIQWEEEIVVVNVVANGNEELWMGNDEFRRVASFNPTSNYGNLADDNMLADENLIEEIVEEGTLSFKIIF